MLIKVSFRLHIYSMLGQRHFIVKSYGKMNIGPTLIFNIGSTSEHNVVLGSKNSCLDIGTMSECDFDTTLAHLWANIGATYLC